MRTADGPVAIDAGLSVILAAHPEIMVARRVCRSPMETHAHPHPPDNQVVRPRRIQRRRTVVEDICHQAASESHQFTNGIAAIDDRYRGLRHGVENFASPLVHEMRRRDDQDRFARVTVLHQRRNADAHHRLAGAHFSVQENGRQAMFDQPGIDGVNALFLRGEGAAFQPGEDVVLPGRVFATIDHRRLPLDLLQQLLTVVTKEGGERDGFGSAIRWLRRAVPIEDDMLRQMRLSGIDGQRCDGTEIRITAEL